MELVKGIPMTEYCDQHHLGASRAAGYVPPDLLGGAACPPKRDHPPRPEADEHPGRGHDDRPIPKVIDFGLAKATGGLQLTEHSLFTAFGTVAGTPLYMAPEQASSTPWTSTPGPTSTPWA